MPKFIIPIMWRSLGLVKVQADSLEEAIVAVEEGGYPDERVDEPFEIDHEGIPLWNSKKS